MKNKLTILFIFFAFAAIAHAQFTDADDETQAALNRAQAEGFVQIPKKDTQKININN